MIDEREYQHLLDCLYDAIEANNEEACERIKKALREYEAEVSCPT